MAMAIWFVVLEYSKRNELMCVKVSPTPTPPTLYQTAVLNTKPLAFKTAYSLAKDYAEYNKIEIRGV